jgi:dTDP-4-dehydrorhamnose reductase
MIPGDRICPGPVSVRGTMRRIFLTGKNGQIGRELERTLAPLGIVTALDIEDLDLAEPDLVRRAIRDLRPDILVNAAAYTAVDQAQSEPDIAMLINGAVPGILAEEALHLDAMLVHYSTDYVFDGEKEGAYTEQDRPRPLSTYGESKLAGERAIQDTGCAHLILRTSWVYGVRGKNFLNTVLGLRPDQDSIPIVDDQIGAPTWCRTVAEATAQILAQCHAVTDPLGSGFKASSGIYHLVSGGSTSWFGFARAILEEVAGRSWRDRPEFASPSQLRAIPTHAYPTPARRPKNSVLSCEKVLEDFGISMPDWRDALRLCLDDVLGSSL